MRAGETMKKECPSCGGSGQISFFKGVSRFLLSTEDCPECSGLGFIIDEEDDHGSDGQDKDGKDEKCSS